MIDLHNVDVTHHRSKELVRPPASRRGRDRTGSTPTRFARPHPAHRREAMRGADAGNRARLICVGGLAHRNAECYAINSVWPARFRA